MNDDGLSVAVVIVNANAGALLERTLQAVARQTLSPRRVIVVDNASADGSVDALPERHPEVELIQLTENAGFAVANNLAARAAADCEWIALLNPDAFPEPGWLEALARATRTASDYAFFGSRLLRADDSGELDGTGDAYHVSGLAWRRDHGRPADGVARVAEEIFSPCAAAALYRRDVFLAAGGFDEAYFCYYEDNDLSFRLRLAGHRCLYVPDAVARHVGSALTGRESDFTLYHSYRNLVWTYLKNMPSPLVWLYLPQCVLMNGLILGGYSLRGRGRVIASAYRDALRDLPRIVRQRRAIQAARAVSALELRRSLEVGASGYLAAFGRAQKLWLRPGRKAKNPLPPIETAEELR